MNKKTLLLTLGIAAGLTSSMQARYHIWFDDPFFATPWVDQVLDFHDRAMGKVRTYIEGFGPSKEEREALKTARENMGKIKHGVKEDDAKVTISFTGFDGLDKKDVKVVKKDGGWFGSITVKDGRIEFFLAPQGVQVTRRIELKDEVKPDTEKQTKATKKQRIKKQRIMYTSSSATEADYFKSHVDITTLKAQSVTPTEFVLTVDKQKEEVLPLS